jgi:hypothetical protein
MLRGVLVLQPNASAHTNPICGLVFDLHAPWNSV